MARADYVYLIERTGTPYRAFTVKHELRRWLRRQSEHEIGLFDLFRLRDDQDVAPSVMSIQDVIDGK